MKLLMRGGDKGRLEVHLGPDYRTNYVKIDGQEIPCRELKINVVGKAVTAELGFSPREVTFTGEEAEGQLYLIDPGDGQEEPEWQPQTENTVKRLTQGYEIGLLSKEQFLRQARAEKETLEEIRSTSPTGSDAYGRTTRNLGRLIRFMKQVEND